MEGGDVHSGHGGSLRLRRSPPRLHLRPRHRGLGDQEAHCWQPAVPRRNLGVRTHCRGRSDGACHQHRRRQGLLRAGLRCQPRPAHRAALHGEHCGSPGRHPLRLHRVCRHTLESKVHRRPRGRRLRQHHDGPGAGEGPRREPGHVARTRDGAARRAPRAEPGGVAGRHRCRQAHEAQAAHCGVERVLHHRVPADPLGDCPRGGEEREAGAARRRAGPPHGRRRVHRGAPHAGDAHLGARGGYRERLSATLVVFFPRATGLPARRRLAPAPETAAINRSARLFWQAIRLVALLAQASRMAAFVQSGAAAQLVTRVLGAIFPISVYFV
mmetsp:Transcript_63837/g.167177  ORF Transcript_63837/g.167177 Transcript_63837/m.167177 type:complete len:327 (+) Transcript_63837:1607-2587(+)